MKIRITKTCSGVDEGNIYPETYYKDKEYDVGDSLCKALLSLGYCQVVSESTNYENKDLSKVSKRRLSKIKNQKAKK